MKDQIINVEGIGKRYDRKTAQHYRTLRDRLTPAWTKPKIKKTAHFWALHDVSFKVNRGEVVGIIGRNGAGKSTLLKILSRVTPPTTGRAEIIGRLGALLEVGTGFHPELTGRENIFLSGSILGMKRTDIRTQFDAIVDFAGVELFLDTPVKRYSSGMRVRLGFAVAAHLQPDVLVIDEVFAVGDVDFQRKCLRKIDEVQSQGITSLVVSHNMGTIQQLSNRVLVLDAGKVVDYTTTKEGIQKYLETVPQPIDWIASQNPDAEASIRNISVRSMVTMSSQSIFNDHPVEITFDLHVSLAINHFVCGFDLLQKGVVVFRSQQVDTGASSRVESGQFSFVCRIPANLLKGGRYSISPYLAIHRQKMILTPGTIEFDFEVFMSNSSSEYHAHFTPDDYPGVIFPVLDWQIVRQ